jgi:hypothetical protein
LLRTGLEGANCRPMRLYHYRYNVIAICVSEKQFAYLVLYIIFF